MLRVRTTGWDKLLSRSAIAQPLRSDELIERIVVSPDGRLRVHCIGWDEYWSVARDAMPLGLRGHLDVLCRAWRSYIQSGFDLASAPSYCGAYFQFLCHLLSPTTNNSTHLALRSLLGLECFVVSWPPGGAQPIAAGAITARHPVYLLAKLKEPKAYDDPKFLPLVCPRESCQDGRESPGLYFHYRQLKIQDDPPASLLVFPATDLSWRNQSFSCLEALAAALSFKPDPRPRQRATLLADLAIAPFLAGRTSPIDISDAPELSFIDLGGGSGALLSNICKHLIRQHPAVVAERKFTWEIVDLSLQDASRRTCSPDLRRHMSYISYQPTDYKTWIGSESARFDHETADVALLCRLLNNMSSLTIEQSVDPEVIRILQASRRLSEPSQDYHPANCLGATAPDCSALIASNARVRLLGGTTYRQASLSDYYRGLWRISRGSSEKERPDPTIFFPLRRFNTNALILDDQTSILAHLADMAELVVIEDVDLTADLLREHLEANALDHLAASDATDRVRMQSARLLCVSRRERQAALPGRRIW